MQILLFFLFSLLNCSRIEDMGLSDLNSFDDDFRFNLKRQ